MKAAVHFLYDPGSIWSRYAWPVLAEIEQTPAVALHLHCCGIEPVARPDDESDAWLEQHLETPARGASPVAIPDLSVIFAVRPLITAVLVAQSLDAARNLTMLRQVHAGLERHGLRLADPELLAEGAKLIGLDREAFDRAYSACDLDEHIAAARRLRARSEAHGRHPLVLETDHGWLELPYSRFAREPRRVRNWLEATQAVPEAVGN